MTESSLRDLPGIELHLHLEGCAGSALRRELLQRWGTGSSGKIEHLLATPKDMQSFLAAWKAVLLQVRSEEDFALYAHALCDYMEDQRLLYAEVFYSPDYYVMQKGLDLAKLHAAIEGVIAERGVHAVFLCDFVRDLGPDHASEFWQRHLKDCGWTLLKGIGIGGSEEGHPPGAFHRLFKEAADRGLGLTAHAGEWCPADSVGEAVRELGVSRVGHGTSAAADPACLALLGEHGVCVDACPGSNRLTGSIGSDETHPLQAFLDAGLRLSLNSDDPGYFGTSLKGELAAAARDHGLSAAELFERQVDAVEASFLLKSRKQDLKNRLYRGWRGLLEAGTEQED